MGVSGSADELAGKLARAGTAVQQGSVAGVREAAIVGKGIFLASLPSRTMRNVPAKLGASFNLRGGAFPVALLRYTGPVHLLNNPIGPHSIAPRRRQRTARGNRRRGAGVLKLPSGGGSSRRGFVDGQVVHKGTTGKRFFEGKARPAVIAAAPKSINRGVRNNLRRVF